RCAALRRAFAMLGGLPSSDRTTIGPTRARSQANGGGEARRSRRPRDAAAPRSSDRMHAVRGGSIGAGVNRRRLVAAILAAVLVVAIVASVAVAVGGGDDDSSDGGGASDPATGAEVQSSLSATIVRDPGEVLPITAAPAEYHVIYRVESAGATEVQVRTEEVSVRRPFDAEVVAYSGDGSTGTVDVVVRSNLGLYADLTDPDAPDIGEGIPAAALGDLRFDGTLGDLVAANLFVPRERRTLLGRECQVYRTGRVVESLAVAAPTDHTYADVCIDAAGIVLEQVAFVDGRAIHYEVATSVEDAPQ